MADPAEETVVPEGEGAKEEKKEETKGDKKELPPASQEAIAAFGRTDNEYWTSMLRRIKHFLVFVFIGPFRFLLVLGTLSLYAILLRLFSLIHHCTIEDVQLQDGLAHKWFLCGKPMSMSILRFFGLRVTRRGDDGIIAEDGKSEARFVVSNHVSMLDIFALFGAGLPNGIPSFVSKAGVFDAPIIGTLLRVCRGIAVFRSNAAGTGTTQVLAQRAADTKEPAVAIYPEGTTTNGSCVGMFHSGAFASGAPVKPICLKYTYTGYNPAYDVISASEWAYGILGATGISLEMIYLPVYVPSEEEKRDARLYARNVRDLIAKELQKPAYDVTFKDKLAYMVQHMNYKMKEHED